MNGIFDLEENSEESKHRTELLKRKYPSIANYLNRLLKTNRPLHPEQREKHGIPSTTFSLNYIFNS